MLTRGSPEESSSALRFELTPASSVFTMAQNGAILDVKPWSDEDRQAALGEPVERFFPPAVAESLASRLAALFKGEPAPVLCYESNGDGALAAFECHFVLLGVDVALVIRHDITPRRRQEQESAKRLQENHQAQRLESLGLLAGGIAHDFNNLLVGVMGNAGLALESLPKNSSARRYVERIDSVARRASNLTRQLLAYAGHQRAERRPVDLNEIIEGMVPLLITAVSKKAMLRVQLSQDSAMIAGDPDQLEQMVMNLVHNASEALCEQAGTITLSTQVGEVGPGGLEHCIAGGERPPGSYVALNIKDDGPGMAPAVFQRAFEPFYSTKAEGRGLGLPAALGIVKAHDGALYVDTAPDQGTRVSVLLASADVAPIEPKASSSVARRPLSDLRGCVLVIDDEEIVRCVIRALLEGVGLRVLEADDGAAGVRIFRRRGASIDVVLVDLLMPGLGGHEVCQAIHAIQEDAKLAFMSGHPIEKVGAQLAELRYSGFLQKPFQTTALVELVAELLKAPRG